MKRKRTSLVIIFLLLFNITLSQPFDFDAFFSKYTERKDVISIFKTIKFSDKEIIFLKSLDEKTLTKIVKIAELVYPSKKNANSQDNKEKELLEKCAQEKATTGNYLNPNCKNLDPDKLKEAVKYLENSYLSNSGGLKSSEQKAFGGPEGETPQSFVSDPRQLQSMQSQPGYVSAAQSLQTGLTPQTFSKYDPTGNIQGCEGFGVVNKASNINLLPQVKIDLGKICVAMKRKIVVVDAVRGGGRATYCSNPCQPPSRHNCSEAIDFETKSYGSRNDQAMLILALIALGFNIGSYQDNFPLHADKGLCPKWQTWSYIARQKGTYLPYQQPVIDALSMMGFSGVTGSANMPRLSRNEMMQRARSAIQRVAGDDFLKKLIEGSEQNINSQLGL